LGLGPHPARALGRCTSCPPLRAGTAHSLEIAREGYSFTAGASWSSVSGHAFGRTMADGEPPVRRSRAGVDGSGPRRHGSGPSSGHLAHLWCGKNQSSSIGKRRGGEGRREVVEVAAGAGLVGSPRRPPPPLAGERRRRPKAGAVGGLGDRG